MIDENAAVFLERGKEFEQSPVPVVSQRCVRGPVRKVHAFDTLDCIHLGMNRIFLLDLRMSRAHAWMDNNRHVHRRLTSPATMPGISLTKF